ncbi:MAG TPA: biotin/lipoyl-binding protein [Thermoprotei archaeon]|nr:biotin/lipoyl-binding protein [Thermoprotei archaeon]
MRKRFRITIEGEVYEVEVEMGSSLSEKNFLEFLSGAKVLKREEIGKTISMRRVLDKNAILSPMSGRVLSIKVKEGDSIQKGDVVVVLESMKTQVEITSHLNGVVEKIMVNEGDFVKTNQIIVKVK